MLAEQLHKNIAMTGRRSAEAAQTLPSQLWEGRHQRGGGAQVRLVRDKRLRAI
jgi:hypothetical protein